MPASRPVQPETFGLSHPSELERLILETADEGFCLFSAGATSQVIAFNQRFADIFGFDSEWLSNGPSAEEVAVAIYLRQRLRAADSQTIEDHIHRVIRAHEAPGGRELELELAGSRMITGRTQSAPGGERLYTFRDITNERRTLEELLAERRRFRDLIEGVSDLIFYEHDTDRRLTYVSPSVTRVLGYRPEELIGHRFGEFDRSGTPDGLATARTSVALAVATKQRQPQYEVILYHKSGRGVACEIMEYPVVEDGRVVGFHGVARDVTEMREMQRRLRERERLAVLGTFAGGLAHDLNNLLLPMRGALDALERHPDPKEARDRISMIRSATDHMSELTAKLLMWTRHQAAEPTAQPSVVTDLYAWAPQAVAFCREALMAPSTKDEAAGPHIDIRLELHSPPRRARIDPDLLKQAVLNLMLNARDAMPEGGEVILRIERSGAELLPDPDPTPPTGQDRWSDGAVRVTVIDRGCGMEESVAERAFDPFFSTKSRGQSTGLGLALVAAIVRAVGGRIHIDTRVGQGTSIAIDLPAMPEESEDAPSSKTPVSILGRALVGLTDSRVAAFVRNGLVQQGLEARIEPGGRPTDDDRVWILEEPQVRPHEIRSLVKRRRNLTIAILRGQEGTPSSEPTEAPLPASQPARPGPNGDSSPRIPPQSPPPIGDSPVGKWPASILWLDGSVGAGAFRRIRERVEGQGHQ